MSEPAPSPRPATGPRGFLRGAASPLRGLLFLLRRRELWPYAAVGGAVNLVFLLVFGAVALLYADDLAAALQPDVLASDEARAWWSAAGAAFARGLIAVFAFLIAMLGAVVGTLVVAAILAGPFQEKLSEMTEWAAAGREPPDEPLDLRTLALDARRAVGAALQRTALFGLVYVPLLLLSAVPVLGLVGAAGTLLYSAFFLGLTFLDPTLERRKLPLRRKLGIARRMRGAWFGFGLATLALMAVPVVSLLLTPAFVVGGTLLWIEQGGDEHLVD